MAEIKTRQNETTFALLMCYISLSICVRHYTPDTGTFLTEDSVLGSVGNLNSQNRYTFAENDPVNNVDPSGHAASLVDNVYARNMAANGSIDEVLNMEIAGTLQQWQN